MGEIEAPPPPPPSAAPEKQEKLSTWAHLLCGWPFFLIFVGGAIGGGLGGAAYGISLTIYKSKLTLGMKILLIVQVGVAAIILYFVIANLFYLRFGPFET